MKNVPEDIKKTIIDVLYGNKPDSEKPISVMQSTDLYHFTFKRIIGGKEMMTSCSYDNDSIIKFLGQKYRNL